MICDKCKKKVGQLLANKQDKQWQCDRCYEKTFKTN